MLQEMRKYAKSWVANIFLGLLTLSFVSWGAYTNLGPAADTSVAKVGGKPIDQQEFRRDFTNAMRSEGERRGGAPLTTDEARKLGLGTAILEQKISNKALDNVVQDLGLTANDATVTALIQRAPVFAGLTGQFDRPTFQRYAERLGYSEQGFIEYVRSDIARSQLQRAIEGNFALPPGYAKQLFSYFFELRAADYIVVDDKAIGPTPPPPDATLQAFIKAHADQFSTPEYRDVSYAYITPADVAAGIKVTDEQVKQAYDEHKSEFVVAEKRDFLQLQFASEAAAKAAQDKVAKGTKFEDLANEKGEKPVLQAALTAADFDAAQAKTLFALAKDGITPPQKTAAGSWVLYKVSAITAGINRTLDQVKEEIRGKIRDEMAMSKLSDVSNAYTDASSSGLNLADAAKKVGMHAARIAAMDANGLAPDGTKTAAPDDAEFRTLVFRAEAGEDGDPQTAKSGAVYVVSVNGVIPPKLKPLDQVRVKALAAWTLQERAAQLKKKAQDLAAQVNRDGSLEGAAKAIGATVQKSPRLQHGFGDDTFTPQLVQSLYQTGPGKAVSGPRAKNGGYVIARVTGIVHPPVDPRSPQYLSILRQLAAQTGTSVTETYIAQQRDVQKVTYNKKVADSVMGSEAP